MPRVIVLHYNAKPLVSSDDPQILDAAKVRGWNIKLERQPAESTDLIILELGFFNAIQFLQDQTSPKILRKLSMLLSLHQKRLIR